ncbi:Ribonuclease H-like protein [Theobroma cacao]|uniref:Ribonuclease H-like protein n=1 Tax=Theobroma cacao TaxID=3641 RepID=A0A061GHK1_THECC|nr:Ribonuclease H-like protein [Theobroma cacao]
MYNICQLQKKASYYMNNRSALQKVLSFLQEYEQVSGQQINHQKSCFITANSCPLSRRQIISHTTGFQHKILPVTYLGAPLYKGLKKVILFYSLITKIRDRVSGWENKVLSSGGCITLLRSVLSSLSMYLLQVPKPSATVIEKIEWHFNSFLWGDSTKSKKMHKAAWSKSTFPCSERGLDIRYLNDIPFDRSQEDVAYWALTSNGELSTWSAWEEVRVISALIPLFICWFLWLERNDAKHRHLGMYPDRVVWETMKLLRQLHDGSPLKQWQWKVDKDIAAMWSFLFPPKHGTTPQIIHWVKPFTGEYKLNVDGSSRNCQSATSGGLLRDHIGKLVFGFSENIGRCNSLQAELRALLRRLLLCKEQHIERLWIEMDALVVIQMIHQYQKGSHDIRYLLTSIRKGLSSISYRILHIFREGNQAAYFLSNQGYTHQNLCLITEAQGELHGMLKLDRLNLPYV